VPAPPTLVTLVEDLVSFVRRLPVEPHVGSTTASTLRLLQVEGPQRISTIADRLGISQPGATQLADRLVQDGTATRSADPTDRRAALVHVTDAGRALLQERHDNRAVVLDGLLARLCPADRRRIDAALPALVHLIALDHETETP
jgi:DNA-binding MarR family transcriptional regulator